MTTINLSAARTFWAIAYHSNSAAPRAKRWYRVSRMVEVDGAIFELYWHPDPALRGNSLAEIRKLAKQGGLNLLNLASGIYRDAPAPRNGATMVRV